MLYRRLRDQGGDTSRGWAEKSSRWEVGTESRTSGEMASSLVHCGTRRPAGGSPARRGRRETSGDKQHGQFWQRGGVGRDKAAKHGRSTVTRGHVQLSALVFENGVRVLLQ